MNSASTNSRLITANNQQGSICELSPPERQSARMSKNKYGGLDQYGASVIFVNENENGEKRENNEFVNEN